MNDQTVPIGAAAGQAGVNIQTLHYYERRGLLKPSRTAANYRVYTPEAIQRVRFIKRSQELGFSLAEIKELLELRTDSSATCADVREHAAEKIADIKQKIQSLEAMLETLERLTAACAGRGAVSTCSILESLDETGDRHVTK